MIDLTDLIVSFLFFSSAMLFILGVLSSLVLHVLRIKGKPKLWICILLVIMPLAYPVKALFPNAIKVPVPLETFQSFDFQPFNKITGENPISRGISPSITDGVFADETWGEETRFLGSEASSTSSTNQPIETVSGYSVDWNLMATLAWVLIFSYLLIRLCIMVYSTDRFLKLSDPVTDPNVLKSVRQCATETGLHHIPHVLTADRIPVPMVMGFFKPGIILPRHLLKPEFREGLRFTLLHEMKHVHEHHNLWLLIESVIGAAYFFHPVIHWAKKRIHEELEHICDNHVIYITNKSISYADFLLKEIWQQNSGRNLALALPFISGVAKTTNRVRSILENTRPTLFAQIRGRFGIGLIFLSFVSLLLCSAAPSAQEPEQILQKMDPVTTYSKDSASFQSVAAEMDKKIIHKEKFSTRLSKEQTFHDGVMGLYQVSAGDDTPDTYEKDAGRVFQEETILEGKSSAIVMAEAGVQAEKRHEKQAETDSVRSVDEFVLINNVEDDVVLAQKASAVKGTSDAATVSETKAAKYLGPPVNWLILHSIEETRILNDQTILFIMYNDDLYLNRLTVPCPGLYIANGFSFESFSDKITKFDRIQAISYGQFQNSLGMLGYFYPYRYEGKMTKAIKLLKNGLLEELVAEGAFKENFPGNG
jgi:beta-lactamase regulating signal transducer with metallopeptidase domain